jgi:hypothetical protein
MFSWFKKKKIKQISASDILKVEMKSINYSPKIILAWAYAIDGNEEFAKFLADNGYLELNMFASALHLKNEARSWLMQNGFPHLMAMINACEGDEKALKWLKMNGLELLSQIALAVEDDETAWDWLKQNATEDLFILTKSIKKVKDKIEENHNDVHNFGRD